MCAFFELAIPALRTNPKSTCTSQQRYIHVHIQNESWYIYCNEMLFNYQQITR